MSASSIALMLPLADAHKSRRTGSKATNLSRVVAAGFAVPRGFVLSADAYRSHLWSGGTREIASANADAEAREAIRAAIFAHPIPEDVWRSIADAYERLSWQTGLPEPKVAVRSSALEGASNGAGYAGAYESCLNVSGLDALNAAVKHVWASLWSGKAAAYRARFASTSEPAMAVIVQQMVEGEMTGTAFTANPVTGDPHGVMVAARSRDGGESAHFTVNLRDLSVVRPPESPGFGADDNLIRLVAEQSILIEDVIGGRAAVEWAVDRDGVWILQADPIADLPSYFPVDWRNEADARVRWSKEDARPLSHFARSLVEAHPQTVGPPCRVVNGYLYVRDDEPGALRVSRLARCAALLRKWDRRVGPSLRERVSGILDADWASRDRRSCARAMLSAAALQRESHAWMRLAERMRAHTAGLLAEIVGDLSLTGRLLCGVNTESCEPDTDAEQQALARFDARGRAQVELVLELARGWIRAADQAGKDCALAGAAVRIVATELVRRAGLIASEDDIFCLNAEELARLPAEPDAAGRAELAAKIARRKHETWLEGRLVAPDALPINNVTAGKTDGRKDAGIPEYPK